MANVDYPEPVRALIVHLKRLPGIGPKSAERIAVWLMQQGSEITGPFAQIVARAGGEVIECRTCGFFATENDGCAICDAIQRDESSLCVVEQPTDILPLERSGAYRGHYHSLRGRISPLDGIGPEELRIGELSERLRAGNFEEVIIALSSDVEGEATANYLAEVLAQFSGLKVTRLAQGMPAGGGLESADELTLMRALQGRTGL
ncbi:recombination mediator RecR [Verrucomicrobiales bacterium]|nr:recombination mediator RecR [Verrucomicrobiales bacterium]MDA9922973.1 recombination mediator RecR [Verrucomicrobiales bacterium]